MTDIRRLEKEDRADEARSMKHEKNDLGAPNECVKRGFRRKSEKKVASNTTNRLGGGKIKNQTAI